jgi:hypothetical protein
MKTQFRLTIVATAVLAFAVTRPALAQTTPKLLSIERSGAGVKLQRAESAASLAIESSVNLLDWEPVSSTGQSIIVPTRHSFQCFRIQNQTGNVLTVNYVGYVKISLVPGFSLFGMPLLNGDNRIGVIATIPDGTTIYGFDDTTGEFRSNIFLGGWSDPSQILEPGRGYFIFNPTEINFELVLLGEIPQGTLTNILPAGFSLRSCIAPISGSPKKMFFPEDATQVLFTLRNGVYESFVFHEGTWFPQPDLRPAEAFWVHRETETEWSFNFSINP